MSEGANEIVEVSGGATFQVGDSITAFTYPLTEGLIIARTVTDENKIELSIIVAPYKKRGQAWSRASVVSRDAARLSKKMPVNFTFPIKNVEVIRLEAKNAKADPSWAFATCVALDRDFCNNTRESGLSESEEQEEEESQVKEITKISNHEGLPVMEIPDGKQGMLDSRVEEVLQLKDKKPNKSHSRRERRSGELSDSDFWGVEKTKKHDRRRRKKKSSKKKKHVTSSSDNSESSSSSSSDSSRTSTEVCEKGRSGCFTCPFHKDDNRGFKDIKIQIKGQAVIRKHVRVALHNLYAEFTTMKSFADGHISEANSSPFKPFSTDTAWLTAYARNIDAILLRSLAGPWSTWNEPVLDEMVIGFLDLIVRVSPNKEYPLCLDDSVRKWMKKKRVGSNSKFGPVSYSLQRAKFTDCGPVVQQAVWSKQKDRNFGRTAPMSSPAKGTPSIQGGGEKKTSPPNQV